MKSICFINKKCFKKTLVKSFRVFGRFTRFDKASLHAIQARQNDLKGGKLMGFVDLILVKNGMKLFRNRSRRFGTFCMTLYVSDKNLALSSLLMAAYNDTYFLRGLQTTPNKVKSFGFAPLNFLY
jgi:hypothetical protein